MTQGKQSVAYIIEDNPLIAELIEETCSEAAYACRVFDDAALALDEMAQVRPDLIVMDLYMPGLSGNELLRCLAAPSLSLRKTPICILTGDPDHGRIEPSRLDLNVRIFTKPEGLYQIEEYLQEIRTGG